MGRWAAGDADIRRTSVDDQGDGRSSVWTDTFAVDDAASGCASPRSGCVSPCTAAPAPASPRPCGGSA